MNEKEILFFFFFGNFNAIETRMEIVGMELGTWEFFFIINLLHSWKLLSPKNKPAPIPIAAPSKPKLKEQTPSLV